MKTGHFSLNALYTIPKIRFFLRQNKTISVNVFFGRYYSISNLINNLHIFLGFVSEKIFCSKPEEEENGIQIFLNTNALNE